MYTHRRMLGLVRVGLVAVVAVLSACVQQPAPVGVPYQGPSGPPQQPAYQQPYAQPVQPYASPFVGTFTIAGGGLTLQQLADGRIAGTATNGNVRLDFEGTVQGNQLVGTVAMDGQRAWFTAFIDEPHLVVTANNQTYRFTRAGAVDAPTPSAPTTAAAPPTTTVPSREPMPPPLAGAAASGAVYADEIDGWAGKAPAGWKALSERQVQAPSKTSKIVVTFYRGLNLQSAYDKFAKNHDDAQQIGSLRETDRVDIGFVLTVEYAQRDGDTRWRVHLIQAADGVLEVTLVTNAAELEKVRPLVDGVARSLRRVTPVRGRVDLVENCYSNLRMSNGVSVSLTLGLDGKGNAQWGGYVNSTIEYQTLDGKRVGTSDTSVEADEDKGVYAIKGDQLIVHWNDGRIGVWTIYWEGGRVAMLKKGGEGYIKC